MKKPDWKKIKKKLTFTLPRVKELDLKLGGNYRKIKEKTKILWQTALGVFKKIWGKSGNRKDDISLIVGMSALMCGIVSAMTYLSNVDRDSPSVTFKGENDTQIVVYPEKEKLYLEERGTYFMADYKRKSMCHGILSHYPIIMFYAESDKVYSMKACREFGKAAGEEAFMDENAKKYEKYIDIAKKQLPPKP